jgi:hypothetical protein
MAIGMVSVISLNLMDCIYWQEPELAPLPRNADLKPLARGKCELTQISRSHHKSRQVQGAQKLEVSRLTRVAFKDGPMMWPRAEIERITAINHY